MRSVTKINAGLTLKFNERKSNKIMENQAVDEKNSKVAYKWAEPGRLNVRANVADQPRCV